MPSPRPAPAPIDHRAVRQALLDWYDAHKRDLPWRRTKDPYRVWISEIMLQQTRVDVATPYYERFLARFPTIDALAGAELESVLEQWSGLGYYRRARMLHQAAGEVVRDHGGRFPDDPKSVLGLPGVGRYTTGAILSICYDQEQPVVDGNVERVLSRLYRLHGEVKKSANANRLWEWAGDLVRGPRPGDLNQSVMELGARVCTPKSTALCRECPVHSHCGAYAHGEVTALPTPKKRAPPREEHWVTLQATKATKWLLRQRKEPGLMQDLWELPTVILPTPGTTPTTEHFRDALKLNVTTLTPLTTLQHGISGRNVTIHVVQGATKGRLPAGHRWLTRERAFEKALTSTSRRLLTESAPTTG